MHHISMGLAVAAEQDTALATRDFASTEEMVEAVSAFLLRFATPDRGPQQIIISVTSNPDGTVGHG